MSAETAGWFYSLNEERKGPFSKEQVSALLSAGVITEHTKVWSEALAEWTPLFRTELRALLGERPVAPPALEKSEAATPPQPRTVQQTQQVRSPAPKTYASYDTRVLANIVYYASYFCGAASLGVIYMVLKEKTLQQQYAKLQFFEGEQMAPVIVIPLLFTVTLFLIWKYRATANLFNCAGPQSVTPAGAVYWYFVPVFWFWKPFEAMSNLWRGFGAGKSNAFLLYVWWFLWLGSIAVTIFAGLVLPEEARTVGEAKAHLFWMAVINGIDALSFFAAADMIKQISNAEHRNLSTA